MLPALWVAKTGLSAQDTNLTTISNNLANVSTTGFKRDRAELGPAVSDQASARCPVDPGQRTAVGSATGYRCAHRRHPENFTAGSLQTTEQPLDMAIDGRGFFQILQPDGTTSYTRDGTFHLDSNGQIVNASGFAWSRPSSSRTTRRASPSAPTAPCRSLCQATLPLR